MDDIAKLKGLSNWAFIQLKMFSGQSNESDKVFIFKMSKVGPSYEMDLVRRMQPGRDLKNSWIIFDHVKGGLQLRKLMHHDHHLMPLPVRGQRCSGSILEKS